MMQISDSYNQKRSLFTALNRFIAAVNNMDQIVMVPSLLRDVPLDDDGAMTSKSAMTSTTTCCQQNGDMYSSYVLLKSIRNDMEWGVLQGDGRVRDRAGGTEADEDDLEKQFHHHHHGLHMVLSKLTRKANALTDRYKEEIGCEN